LGPEKFGLISFASALIAYFITIVDYGFNLSATREISINRDNKQKINEIFSSVIIIKLILTSLSILLLMLLVQVFDRFNRDSWLFYSTFLMVIGNAFYPVWFFQGIEDMKVLLFVSVTFKALSVLLIFLLIHTANDALLVVIINSGNFLVSGLAGLIIAIVYFDIKMRLQPIKTIKYHFKEGGYIFLSTAAINLYTSTNVFLLGLFTNDSIVGYFSAADKIRQAIQASFSTLSQTIYPHLSKLFAQSLAQAVIFVKRIFFKAGFLIFLLCVLTFIFSDEIITLVVGEKYGEAIIILKILSFLPFIIFMSNIFGIQIMVNLGYKKEFTKIVGYAAIINMLLSLILIPIFYAEGTAISIVFTEVFVTSAMFIFLKKRGIEIF